MRKGYKLPQVIPIVFYTGFGKWTVERDIMDRVMVLKGFERYVPKMEYLLIDVNEINAKELLNEKNALSGILYMEIGSREDVRRTLEDLKRSLEDLKVEELDLLRKYIRVMIESALEEDREDLRKVIEEVEDVFTGLKTVLEKEREEGMEEARREDILNAEEAFQNRCGEDLERTRKDFGSRELEGAIRRGFGSGKSGRVRGETLRRQKGWLEEVSA